MARWLNALFGKLGVDYRLVISTLPFGEQPHWSEVVLHTSFQCLTDFVAHPDFCLEHYDTLTQNEIVELYWWWHSVYPLRASLSNDDEEARIVYVKEDSEMLQRLIALRNEIASR